MEYMDGGSLSDIQKAGFIFGEPEVAVVAYSVVMALLEMHNAHLVHRDIKPDNILIGNKEENVCIYFIDFGL